jgi:RND family efflux transporter MFP subunit
MPRPNRAAVPAAFAAWLALALGACSEDTSPDEEPPRPVVTAEAVDGATIQARSVPGVVRRVDRSKLSFEVPGRIETINVDIGDEFKADEPLARLDRRPFRLAVEERRSRLAEAEAAFEEARADLERQRDLFEDGWVSRSRLDTAEAASETAKARRAAARSALAIAEEDLRDATLSAPYDGVVTDRLAEPAEQVAPGTPVLDVEATGSGLELVASVPEAWLSRIERGADHAVTFPAFPDANAQGRITEIGASARPDGGYPVILRLKSEAAGPPPGSAAEVRLQINAARSRGAVAVPTNAVLGDKAGEGAVFVVEEGTARRVEVSVLAFREGTALVRGELQPGARVVAEGAAFLSDGQSVTVLEDEPRRFNP